MEHTKSKDHEGDTTLLKVVGLVMCLGSIPYIVVGVPLSFVLVGLPVLAFGIAMLYYGISVYGLKKGTEVGAMVVLALNVIGVMRFGYWPLLALIGIYIIYTNRERFVK